MLTDLDKQFENVKLLMKINEFIVRISDEIMSYKYLDEYSTKSLHAVIDEFEQIKESIDNETAISLIEDSVIRFRKEISELNYIGLEFYN